MTDPPRTSAGGNLPDPPAAADPLLRFRPEFPILERSTYLISNSLGAMPRCELNARDVVVDYRSGVGIRLSPHFYTEDAELDRAFAAIDEIRGNGAWRRWREHTTLVT